MIYFTLILTNNIQHKDADELECNITSYFTGSSQLQANFVNSKYWGMKKYFALTGLRANKVKNSSVN